VAARQPCQLSRGDLGAALDEHIIGRNVLEGRWTFQIVEEYDATYWSAVRSFADHARLELAGGALHVHESSMKDRRRTDGRRHHERRPRPGA
jgi:hypothetical protein